MLRASLAVVWTAALTCAVGCSDLRFEHLPEPTREQLQRLVDGHANQAKVAAELGAGFTLYAKGSESWRALESCCASVPSAVRPLIQKYPTIMYYTTSYQYTWLFFDEAGRLKEFRIGSQ
jgi:hypothetical protein